MVQVIEGEVYGAGQKHAIVVARWNDFITGRLLEGALDAFRRHGVAEEDITVVHVPGAFEIGVTAMNLARSGKFHAITCLGAVIRGATPHFDFVAGQSASAISSVSTTTGVPAVYGIVTTDTIEQAIERAGTKAGNKGFEAALVSIEMASVLNKIDQVK